MSEELIPAISYGFAIGLTVGFALGAMFTLNVRPLVRYTQVVSHRVHVWVGHVRDRT